MVALTSPQLVSNDVKYALICPTGSGAVCQTEIDHAMM